MSYIRFVQLNVTLDIFTGRLFIRQTAVTWPYRQVSRVDKYVRESASETLQCITLINVRTITKSQF